MTRQRSKLHIETPIDDLEEIPYDRSQMGPGSFVLEVEFNSEEIDRLVAGLPDDDRRMIRFIKRAALEVADREAKAKAADSLQAAD